jgi:hypothetical protein
MLLSPALQHSNLEIVQIAGLCLTELVLNETGLLDLIWELTERESFQTQFDVASALFSLILTSLSHVCSDMVAARIFRFFAKWFDFDSQELTSNMVKVLARRCLADESGEVMAQASERGIGEKWPNGGTTFSRRSSSCPVLESNQKTMAQTVHHLYQPLSHQTGTHGVSAKRLDGQLPSIACSMNV